MKKIHNPLRKLSSSLHKNIREAAFIPIEEKGMIKYAAIREHINKIRAKGNMYYQACKLKALEWDAEGALKDSFIWMFEALIEGVTASFATHTLFGLPFNVSYILSHGIIIKQGLDILWRIRTHGATNKIQEKIN